LALRYFILRTGNDCSQIELNSQSYPTRPPVVETGAVSVRVGA